MDFPEQDHRRGAGSLPLFIPIEASGAEPVQMQVYRGLRRAITDGRLSPGDYLPSTRALAADLCVGRNTVLRALRRLRMEGLIESRAGSGVVVRERPGRESVAPVQAERKGARAPRPDRSIAELRGSRTPAGPGAAIPFRVGAPPLDLFPARAWARLSARRWRSSGRVLLERGAATGYGPLRETIANLCRASRGIECDPRQVIVTTGSYQSVTLIARTLLRPGDAVWIEDPGPVARRNALTAFGARVIPVEIDRDGMDPALASEKGPAKLALVTPSCHFPSGMTLALERRIRLVEWARTNNGWILEDDRGTDTRFIGRALPPLTSLDEARRTIYMGSFEMSMFPGLHVGFVVVPPSIVDAATEMRQAMEPAAALVTQAVLADFIDGGHYARHVRILREAVADRHDALFRALTVRSGAFVDIWPANAGMHLIARLPEGVSERQLMGEARLSGLDVRGLAHYRTTPGRPGLVLCYGGWRPPGILDAVDRLTSVLERSRSSLPVWDREIA